MLDQVLGLFEIVPDFDLNLMKPGQSLSEVTSRVLLGLEPILRSEQPDWVLVQGDTATAMAASLAAYYQKIRVGHVEAGLRTGDKYQPFPEEVNRRVVGVISDLHFAPTHQAADNLRREGVPEAAVLVTGNTVIDAIQWVAARPEASSGFPVDEGIVAGKRLITVTAHRRENFGSGIIQICAAIRRIVAARPDTVVVYPVHPNPNVSEPVHRLLGGVPGVVLLPPLEYSPLVALLKRSTLVITDSGGVQEEAPGLGKPVLVLRETTERPEGVASGTARLVGVDPDRIVSSALELLDDHRKYESMARSVNPYGDGLAAERIVDRLVRV